MKNEQEQLRKLRAVNFVDETRESGRSDVRERNPLHVDHDAHVRRSGIVCWLAVVCALLCPLLGMAEGPNYLKDTYEDRFTFKRGKSYFRDPFIWAYTAEFAERFRMPKEWIDPELKGALAVAWRMTTIGDTTCGLGGREENCWPPLTGQLDIYFDAKTPLPWRYTDIVRDNFMRGIDSTDFLPWLSLDSPSAKYVAAHARGTPLLNGGLRDLGKDRKIAGGHAGSVKYFDRELEPGVVLVGLIGTTPHETAMGPLVLPLFTQEEQTRTRGNIERYVHELVLSKGFVQRMKAIYRVQNKPNRDVIDRLREEFLQMKRNTTPAQ